MTTNQNNRKVRFLRDEPADEDFFGTHERLAQAVAQSLVCNPDLRTIGLLGKWGSGKSTVLRRLEAIIEDNASLSDIKVFTYDAWEHQGGPVRRDFLESLFTYVTEAELIDKNAWQPDIDRLTGQSGTVETVETATLSKRAKEILISLAMLPFGLSLMNMDTLHEGLGETRTAIGQGTLFVATLCFVVPAIFLSGLFFGKKKDSTDSVEPGDEFFSLIFNKETGGTTTKVIKSQDPSPIEFSQTCARIVNELSQRGRRLLCVIDNLDRLPADDALVIWSAVRAIFASIHSTDRKQGHPFVLVPMDSTALASLFGSTAEALVSERANSFVEKTFDVTFRVPPPVRSDWKEFLRRQMENVFGKRMVTDHSTYFIERVFDQKYNAPNQYPTPRIINRFVNLVATTWLARDREHFPLAVVSLFAANLDEVDKSVLDFTQKEDLAYFDADYRHWRDQVAALYFGVPQSKSRQVLLEGPLKSALEATDVAAFRKLLKYPGSFKVFDDLVRTHPYDRMSPEAIALFSRAASLLSHLDQRQEGVRRAWSFIVGKVLEIEAIPALGHLRPSAEPFQRSLSGDLLRRFAAREVDWLSGLAATADDADSFAVIGKEYQRLTELVGAKGLPKISLNGETLPILRAIYWINSNEILEPSTTVGISFSSLAPELARLVDDEDEASIVPEVIDFRRKFPAAFPKESLVALAPIREKALAAIARTFSPQTALAARALGLMTSITVQSEEEVDAHLDAGHFQARANEAIGANDFEAAGVLLAIAIARGKPFNVAIEAIPDSNNRRELFSKIQETLDSISKDPLRALWTAAQQGHSDDLLRDMVDFTVRERAFSPAELDTVADDAEFYLSPLGRNLRYLLSKKVGVNPERVRTIGKLHPSSLLADILSALVRSGAPDARDQSKATVESLPAETWMGYLSGTSEWVMDLVEKCPSDYRLGANSNAASAALQLIDSKSANLTSGERARLKRLQQTLNRHALAKIFDKIIEQAAANPRHVLSLFKQANEQLTEHLTRNLSSSGLIGLLAGFSGLAPTRTWFEDHLNVFQAALSRFARKERTAVGNWMRAERQSSPRVRANWLELIGNRLGIDTGPPAAPISR